MEGSIPTGPFWLVKRSVWLLPSMLATLMLSPSVQYSFLQGEGTMAEGPWCQQLPAPSQPCRPPHLLVAQAGQPHTPLSHPQEEAWGLPKPHAHLDCHTLVDAHLSQPLALCPWTHSTIPSPVTLLPHADTQGQPPFCPPPHVCTITHTHLCLHTHLLPAPRPTRLTPGAGAPPGSEACPAPGSRRS